MSKEQTIEVFKGKDNVFEIEIQDDSGAALDISAWVLISFVMRDTDDPNDTAHIANIVGDGITVTDGANGIIEVGIEDTDTDSLEARHYRWGVARQDAGSEAMTNTGNIILKEAIIA